MYTMFEGILQPNPPGLLDLQEIANLLPYY